MILEIHFKNSSYIIYKIHATLINSLVSYLVNSAFIATSIFAMILGMRLQVIKISVSFKLYASSNSINSLANYIIMLMAYS